MIERGSTQQEGIEDKECLLCGLPHGLEDVGHLLPLPLGPHVLADPLLQELQATLVLVDPERGSDSSIGVKMYAGYDQY